MNYSKRFRIKPGSAVALGDIDPDFCGDYADKDDAQGVTADNARRLERLQELLYAERKRALLLCFQGIDASGKDGVIGHVMGAMNPQGCKTVSFKQPNASEAAHDYLWRIHCEIPAKGEVAAFNRSHYEDVLIPRVHKLLPKPLWSKRYAQINDMERYLSENGVHILKFFMHISKDEQLKRFKARLDDPSKHWKIAEADYTERERWDDYQAAFGDIISHCSTEAAPWFVIPANHKWFRNLAVSQIVADYLEGLDMQFPAPAVSISKIRKQFHKAEKN
jgi:PPK2 family polyphosphate:nucleotide phosphotransferase